MPLLIDQSDLRLRPFVPGDAPALARHANDPAVARHLRERFPQPYAEADAAGWIGYLLRGDGDDVAYAIEVDGEAAGCIGVVLQHDVHRHSAELGYWLGQRYWGRRIMRRVVPVFCDWASEALGLRRIYATVFCSNPASARVLEHSGFRLEGILRDAVFKHGGFIDEWMYARVTATRPET